MPPMAPCDMATATPGVRSRCVGSRTLTAATLIFFFQAEDGIRDYKVTGVQTCALPICEQQGDVRDLAGGYFVFQIEFDALVGHSSDAASADADTGCDVEFLPNSHAKEIGRASCRERV